MISDKDTSPLMQIQNVSLQMGGVQILKHISFEIPKASFIGVIGERGAGKSSLLKILTGVLKKSTGTLRFKGAELDSNYSPIISSRYGIMAIYQEPMVIPALNAWQNIFLNRELKKGFFYDHRRMHQQVLEAFRILSIQLDPDLPLEYYNSDQHLMVEFARILCFSPELVLIDDISSRLTPAEQEKIFGMCSAMLREGISVVYFSSSLIDALNAADKLLILQHGEIVDEVEKGEGSSQLQIDYSQFFTRIDLERKNLELFHQQLFNESVMNSLPLPILVLNPRQEIVLANTAMLHLCGSNREQLKSHGLSLLFKASEKELDNLYTKIRLREEAVIDHITIRRGNNEIPISLRSLPVFRKDTYFGMILLFLVKKETDVSFRGKESELYDSFAQLIAKTAHEINNPLGIILNHIQLMKSSFRIEEVHDSIAPIEKEINRIKRIIGSLIQKDTPEESAQSVAQYSVPYRLLPELKNFFDPALREQNISLTIQGQEEVVLNMREDECRQILLNLIMNSIEAMPNGGEIRVKYGKTQKNGKEYGFISVLDTGTGIKKEILPEIFNLFFSTKQDKHAKGIGLSLCKDIVEKCGGFIEVSSEEGRGSEFTVLIPERELY